MTTERPGTPGTAWETQLRRYEVVADDDRDQSPFGWDDTPNRATRRQARRQPRRNRR